MNTGEALPAVTIGNEDEEDLKETQMLCPMARTPARTESTVRAIAFENIVRYRWRPRVFVGLF